MRRFYPLKRKSRLKPATVTRDIFENGQKAPGKDCRASAFACLKPMPGQRCDFLQFSKSCVAGLLIVGNLLPCSCAHLKSTTGRTHCGELGADFLEFRILFFETSEDTFHPLPLLGDR